MINILLGFGWTWFGVGAGWYWAGPAGPAACWSSFVLIRERSVGIVIKRFAAAVLAPGRLIALDGEAGYQADTLAPGCTSATGRGSTGS